MTDTADEFPAAWWPRPSIRMSRDFGEFAADLADAQAEMNHPKKEKTNPQFRSKYADLPAVIDAVKVLNKHGIAVIGSTDDGGDSVRVLVLFAHSSGQWQEGSLVVPLPAATAQGLGSALTYGRRYLLSLMCNVASDDDDDGAEASAVPGVSRPAISKPSPIVENRVIPGSAVATIRRDAAALGASDAVIDAAVIVGTNGRTERVAQVWTSEFAAVREALENWGKENPNLPTLENA